MYTHTHTHTRKSDLTDMKSIEPSSQCAQKARVLTDHVPVEQAMYTQSSCVGKFYTHTRKDISHTDMKSIEFSS